MKFFTHKSFQPNDTKGNLSSQANLIYNTRIWRFSSDWVYVDDDFTSDLGFIPRTGIFKSGTSASRNFYPNNKNINSYSFSLLNLMWFQKNLDYKKTDHFFSFEYELEFKKQSKLGIEFKILCDDGYEMFCVRAQQNGKAIHSCSDNALMGLYFRQRLNLEPG